MYSILYLYFIKKIKYNKTIANAKKKILLEKSFDDQLDKIEINGKEFMRKKISINESANQEYKETLRIYASDEMLDVLEDKNYSHFFLDGTFKCVPRSNE